MSATDPDWDADGRLDLLGDGDIALDEAAGARAARGQFRGGGLAFGRVAGADDDLGASLTRITLLSQSVGAEIEDAKQARADVDQIYQTARDLTRAMDEIVWAVNPKHDTLDSLVTYLGRFAQSFMSTAGTRCRRTRWR